MIILESYFIHVSAHLFVFGPRLRRLRHESGGAESHHGHRHPAGHWTTSFHGICRGFSVGLEDLFHAEMRISMVRLVGKSDLFHVEMI